MDDLAAFLRARWDCEETRAKATESGDDWRNAGGVLVDRDVDGWNASANAAYIATFQHTEDADHAALWSPGKVLTEIAVRRRILDLHHVQDYRYEGEDVGLGCAECGYHAEYSDRGGWCETARLLALPYADHPDYRQGWRL
jgi:hypothetical protein